MASTELATVANDNALELEKFLRVWNNLLVIQAFALFLCCYAIALLDSTSDWLTSPTKARILWICASGAVASVITLFAWDCVSNFRNYGGVTTARVNELAKTIDCIDRTGNGITLLSLNVLLDSLRQSLALQLQQLDALDNKNGILGGVSVIAVTATVSIVAANSGFSSSPSSWGFAAAAILLASNAMLVLLYVTLPRSIAPGPVPLQAFAELSDYQQSKQPEIGYVWVAADKYLRATIANQPVALLKSKASSALIVLSSLGLAAVIGLLVSESV